MKEQINIGVLGCANIAKRSVIPAIQSLPQYNLKAVSSRTAEKAKSFADIFQCEAIEGYENIVTRDDIDAIYLPLPTGIHEEWVIKCLENGKHLLVEKSFAQDYSSAQKMISIAKENNLLIMEDFMFLYHSQQKVIKDIYESGVIGELRCFRSSFGFPPLQKGNFRYDQALGGGSLLDSAAYTVKASQLFLGDSIQVRAARLNYEQEKVDIFGGAFLSDDSGLIAEVAFGFDNFYQCNYELWGSKGKLIANKSFTPKANEKPSLKIEVHNKVENIQLAPDNHFVRILEAFHQNILSGDYQKHYDELLTQSKLLEQIKTLSADG